MAKRFIRKVTVTGADDSVAPVRLLQIAEEYPFVEFGILLSKKQQGTNRFPSLNWIMELKEVIHNGKKPVLSGHICGHWVRDICMGGEEFFNDCLWWEMFERFQLNFHAEPHNFNLKGFKKIVTKYGHNRQFIFQVDGVNDNLFHLVKKILGGNTVVCLFDKSGGVGELPNKWPSMKFDYSGYAGGLSPENIEEQLEKIAKTSKCDLIWIDFETYARSNNDSLFDVDNRVIPFLELTKPWIR